MADFIRANTAVNDSSNESQTNSFFLTHRTPKSSRTPLRLTLALYHDDLAPLMMQTIQLPQNKVHILDPQVAERIAAGEVIERPGSVVKELVENAIDAGATIVQVSLHDGGKNLIEVLDNGEGMTSQDLETSILRHATSKLSALQDLEKISTLGFRGEALPSVSAAGNLNIISKNKYSDRAYSLDASSQNISSRKSVPTTFGHFLSSAHGTRVQVSSLFSQIPARLKFLKSQAAEVSFVREWLERIAMTHPEIHFKLFSNDRCVLNLPSSTQAQRVEAILSDQEGFPLLSLDLIDESDWLKLKLYWLQGYSSPQMRKIVQVINGRAVKDRLLQQALLTPFRQHLLPGQFPALALFLELDPSQIDVNVHPTKSEVRFLDSRSVFHHVQSLASRLIETHGAPTFIRESSEFGTSEGFSPTSPVSQTKWALASPGSGPALGLSPAPSFGSALDRTETENYSRPLTPSEQLRFTPTTSSPTFLGQAFSTYLLFQVGPELQILDQHAAHERIRYEDLKASLPLKESQQLLIPEAFRYLEENRAEVLERLPRLSEFGFDAEPFGEDTVVFRAVPAAWGNEDLKIRLKSLIDRLPEIHLTQFDLDSVLKDEALFEKIASQACHSSVRAHDQLTEDKALVIYKNLFDCKQPWNCPHGRPTVLKMTEAKFEEWFQRKVPH